MSLVNISLVGNLVKPPEQMYFASGRVKTTMVVAINSPGRGGRGDTADFYRVESWGRLAELAGQYLSKGNQVGVTGRLILDHWTDKTGKSRVTPIVEATQLAFPPRLKVLSEDDQAAADTDGGNPISGEVVVPDQDEENPPEPTDDTAYGNPFVAEEPAKSKAGRGKSRTA